MGERVSIGRRDKEAVVIGKLLGRYASEDLDAPKELTIFEEEHGATPTFGLVLDVGWAERIIASGMYAHDALGIAYALACVFDCPIVEPEWPS